MYGWGMWAGNHVNYKCTRNREGIWLTEGNSTIGEFFKGIDKYIHFEGFSFSAYKCN
jgi:hypothetical protein